MLSDLYGCDTPELANKRRLRNPFRRSTPYELACPELKDLLAWCGPGVFRGALPWTLLKYTGGSSIDHHASSVAVLSSAIEKQAYSGNQQVENQLHRGERAGTEDGMNRADITTDTTIDSVNSGGKKYSSSSRPNRLRVKAKEEGSSLG